MSKRVVALLIADLHISAAPPIARTVGDTEEDRRSRWRQAMGYHLAQLHRLAIKHQVPIIVAGDIWHTTREPLSIVNWLLRHIPENVRWYGVSGQHDQPNHQLDRIKESPYWTLVEAGRMIDLKPGEPVEVPGADPLRLHGFPYGVPIKPLKRDHISSLCLEIAVVHQYVWRAKASYANAPVESHADRLPAKGFDVVVIGDNHQSWQKDTLFNCGAYLRRNSDEEGHKPSIGKLYSDGSIKRHYPDVSKDKWNRNREVKSTSEEVDVRSLVRELHAGKTTVDFCEAMKRWLREHPVSDSVKQEIAEAMGE